MASPRLRHCYDVLTDDVVVSREGNESEIEAIARLRKARVHLPRDRTKLQRAVADIVTGNRCTLALAARDS